MIKIEPHGILTCVDSTAPPWIAQMANTPSGVFTSLATALNGGWLMSAQNADISIRGGNPT